MSTSCYKILTEMQDTKSFEAVPDAPPCVGPLIVVPGLCAEVSFATLAQVVHNVIDVNYVQPADERPLSTGASACVDPPNMRHVGCPCLLLAFCAYCWTQVLCPLFISLAALL